MANHPYHSKCQKISKKNDSAKPVPDLLTGMTTDASRLQPGLSQKDPPATVLVEDKKFGRPDGPVIHFVSYVIPK
jgi:hypothetical protein